MILFGPRIREERERLGLTQSQLGVTPQAQRRYEKGERSPDIEYLAQFAELGADALYLVTGQRSASTPDQQQLLAAYAAAPPALRAAALAVLTSQPEAGGLRVVPPVSEAPTEVGALPGEKVRKARSSQLVRKSSQGGTS